MRQEAPLFALAASAVTAFVLVAAIFLSPDLAIAGEKPGAKVPPAASVPAAPRAVPAVPAAPAAPNGPAESQGGAQCTCPGIQDKQKLWHKPKFADLRHELDETDEMAALESVQFALSEVGDGASYVWHRRHGKLSGIVQPTASFKDGAGKVCRHIVVMLSAGSESRKTEGIACRLVNGRWQLEG